MKKKNKIFDQIKIELKTYLIKELEKDLLCSTWDLKYGKYTFNIQNDDKEVIIKMELEPMSWYNSGNTYYTPQQKDIETFKVSNVLYFSSIDRKVQKL